MNRIIIKGRIAREIEIRQTQTGKSVGSFSVAVDKGFGENKSADFFRVQAWEKTADFVAKYFSKGKEILIEGRMESREYTDANGKNCIVWELIAERVEFCGGARESTPPAGQPPISGGTPADDDDPYPF